ncbi:hypothetical protein T439DRAFT_286230 [Meredithblackwellia eburnea MCA 4105]
MDIHNLSDSEPEFTDDENHFPHTQIARPRSPPPHSDRILFPHPPQDQPRLPHEGPAFTVFAPGLIADSGIPLSKERIDPLISLERPAANAPLELLIMGSGGSAAVPDISCLTAKDRGCEGCIKTLKPSGSKNVRGNTGAILRVPQSRGREKVIMIDCGKTFREQAIRLFPKKGLRMIDAVILTHHHADAIDGLDDLRAWTFKSAIEKTIPIYLNQATYDAIAESFRYMTDKKAASGGGALPSFKWKIMPNNDTWWVEGVKITPLPVHHGIYFTSPPSPLISLGFLINSSVLYLSDVSFIPPETWDIIAKEVELPHPSTSKFGTSMARCLVPLPRLQALIIDCTGLRLSKSHYGLPQALEFAHRLGARKTYLTDMPHKTSHECWLHFCRVFSEGKRHAHYSLPGQHPSLSTAARKQKEMDFPIKHSEGDTQPHSKYVYEGFDYHVEDFSLFTERAMEAIEDWCGGILPKRWVRPLADGMTISWTEGEEIDWSRERVWDDEYADEDSDDDE